MITVSKTRKEANSSRLCALLSRNIESRSHKMIVQTFISGLTQIRWYFFVASAYKVTFTHSSTETTRPESESILVVLWRNRIWTQLLSAKTCDQVYVFRFLLLPGSAEILHSAFKILHNVIWIIRGFGFVVLNMKHLLKKRKSLLLQLQSS